MNKQYTRTHLAVILITLFLWLAYFFAVQGLPYSASAQEDSLSWSEPQNISQSGSGISPIAVIDSSGKLHVIWPDILEGFSYTGYDGSTWTDPVLVNFPFNRYTPVLLGGEGDIIHALWTNERGFLLYSRVSASEFGNSSSWESGRILAESAVNYQIIQDQNGALWVAYIRSLDTPELPAGVYYRQSSDLGNNWSPGNSLYTSRYFRSSLLEDTHISLSSFISGDSTRLYVTWDNRLINRVFFTHSNDGGQNWGEVIEIDGPSSAGITSEPNSIMAYPQEDKVLLIWQVSILEGAECTKYYQISEDGGETWSRRQSFLNQVGGCMSGSQMINYSENLNFLWTTIQDQMVITAWDGESWSPPQTQSQLTSFEDRIRGRLVALGCPQPILMPDRQLHLVGCDTEEYGDIWSLSRSLGEREDWYSLSQVWSSAITYQGEDYFPYSIGVLADEQGFLHTYWNQPVMDDDGQVQAIGAIYYARVSNELWSLSGSVIKSEDEEIANPSATIAPNGRLLITYTSGEFGELKYSWASASRANNISEWNPAVTLPSINTSASNPDIASSADGQIFVVFAVPLNEQRGIYITKSLDDGVTWTQPRMIFDAVANDWPRVDQPHIGITSNGTIHVIWTRLPLPGDLNTTGIYYSKSSDGGETWSQEETVVDTEVGWTDIITFDGQTIHRVWSETTRTALALWHEVSKDGGLTWTRSTVFSSFGDSENFISSALSPSGELYLSMIVNISQDNWGLRHWIWNGERWANQDYLQLDLESGEYVISHAAAFNPRGYLSILYTTKKTTDSVDQYAFYEIQREFESTVPLPTETAESGGTTSIPLQTVETPVPENTITSTEEPDLLPTPTQLSLSDLDNIGPSRPAWMGTVMGGAAAGIVVIAIMALFAIRHYRRSR